MKCPRCQTEVDELLPTDIVGATYKGPMTKACRSCIDAMVAGTDFPPSSTTEYVLRARRTVEKQRREMAAVRRRQWLWRITVAFAIVAAALVLWRRFFA